MGPSLEGQLKTSVHKPCRERDDTPRDIKGQLPINKQKEGGAVGQEQWENK